MRSLLWALLVFAVLGSAALTASASTRLLAPPTVEANPTPPVCEANDAASIGACERWRSHQASFATLQRERTPCAHVAAATGDTCDSAGQHAGANDPCSQVGQNDRVMQQACSAQMQVDPQRSAAAQACNNTAVNICADMPTHTTMNAQVLTPGTARPYPPFCQGLAAPDPRCTGGS